MKKNSFASVDVIEDGNHVHLIPLTKNGTPSKIDSGWRLVKKDIAEILVGENLVYGEFTYQFPSDLLKIFGPGSAYVIWKHRPENKNYYVEGNTWVFESHYGELKRYVFQEASDRIVVKNTIISSVEQRVFYTNTKARIKFYQRLRSMGFDSATYLDDSTLILTETETYGISKGIKTISYIDTETFEVKKIRRFFEGIEL